MRPLRYRVSTSLRVLRGRVVVPSLGCECQNALQGMDLMRQVGVKVAFGTDLLGRLYIEQCREFQLRAEVFSPIEILRQATSVSADCSCGAGS